MNIYVQGNLNIGKQIEHVDTINENYYSTPQPLQNIEDIVANEIAKERDVPEVLDTPKARTIWQIAQERGWVNKNLQPILPKAKAALLANMIIDKLGLRPKWSILEDFWQIPNLRIKYDKAMESANANDFLGEITAAYKSI